jgi:hypothetical protein
MLTELTSTVALGVEAIGATGRYEPDVKCPPRLCERLAGGVSYTSAADP